MILRPVTPADLPRILEIQTLAPQAAQWGEGSYRKIAEGEPSLAGNVAEVGAEVTGFLIYRSLGADEIEILNLAVASEYRRKGFGRSLVVQLLSQTGGSVFLEVRESNAAAIDFYHRLGILRNRTSGGLLRQPARRCRSDAISARAGIGFRATTMAQLSIEILLKLW